MSSSKSHRSVYPAYALRLVQEVAQQKWLLKPATRQDRALRKAAWSKIATKLNAEFSADFTAAELERKIDHVKAKAHKNQVQRCKLTGEKLPGSHVFDLSSDDDPTPDVTIASTEGNASTSSSNAQEISEEVAEKPSVIQIDEPTNSKTTSSREAVDDCIMTEEKGRGINDSNKQVEPSAVESTKRIALMTKEQQAAKAVVHPIKASDEKLPSNGVSPSTPSSVISSSHGYIENVRGNKAMIGIGSEAVSSLQDGHSVDWMDDFKAKLLQRLATVPTDRILEVHRLIRHEIDSIYAEEIAKEIDTRFKDVHREDVKDRVLRIVGD